MIFLNPSLNTGDWVGDVHSKKMTLHEFPGFLNNSTSPVPLLYKNYIGYDKYSVYKDGGRVELFRKPWEWCLFWFSIDTEGPPCQ